MNSSIPRSPLDLENMVVGTETQRFIDDCITPVPLSGLSAYLGTGYRAKEQVIITLHVKCSIKHNYSTNVFGIIVCSNGYPTWKTTLSSTRNWGKS